eukprot:GHVT01014645.1.p1 GENE.GHVT01014645.1~~GHVT01014645.1.p1  ORF type:complete len:140 (-),score=14.51 GHVT01014645.1:683-1102(-)
MNMTDVLARSLWKPGDESNSPKSATTTSPSITTLASTIPLFLFFLPLAPSLPPPPRPLRGPLSRHAGYRNGRVLAAPGHLKDADEDPRAKGRGSRRQGRVGGGGRERRTSTGRQRGKWGAGLLKIAYYVAGLPGLSHLE